MKRILFLLFLIPFLVSLPENKKSGEVLTFTPPLTGIIDGMVNIHGVKNDTTLSPPSLNPGDWEILNNGKPVVHHSQTVGERKIDPVGFYLTENNLALFYNSGWDNYDRWFELRDERGYAGSTNQAGSLIAFNDNWNIKDYHDNPVFDQPQRKWQGRNRTNPYALVWHPVHEMFYCFYGDFAEGGDNDLYPGRRALGLAKSSDLVNWEYLTVDEPLFHIQDMYDFHPETFEGLNHTRSGRVYAFGAVYYDGWIYMQVGGSADGQNYTFVIRSRNADRGWEFVGIPEHRPMAIPYKGKWYTPRNIRDPKDSDKRAIGIVVNDSPISSGSPEYIFSTGYSSSAGVSRQLFMFNGRWHVAYRQSDEDDNRSMYIARQK